MDIDISYIVQDTPNKIMQVFMDHAQNLEDRRIQIDLDSVNIDEWTEDDVVSRDEDGNEEIDYSFSAQIVFEFKSLIQDREEIIWLLEASFPGNIFSVASIKPSMNENDSTVHQLHRDVHNNMLNKRFSLRDPGGTDLINRVSALSPEEKEHFFKIAKRTLPARQSQLDAKSKEQAAEYRRQSREKWQTPEFGSDETAEAYPGNSNDEMLTIKYPEVVYGGAPRDAQHRPYRQYADDVISLDMLDDMVDTDDDSEEGLEAINQALWTKAKQIAKAKGMKLLIDTEANGHKDGEIYL
jgi:hypothetical protein